MDPRMDRTRRHVLDCARELLIESGAEHVTFSGVARRARVSRNTLYRHWPTREQLLVDVILRHYRREGLTEEGLIEDGPTEDGRSEVAAPVSLGHFLYSLRDSLESPGARSTLTALIAQAEHDAVSEGVLRRVADLRQRGLGTLAGPLSDAAFARIVGPLFFQAVIARRPLDDTFMAEILAALQAERGQEPARPRAERPTAPGPG
ncbi:TetR/AcrR family transcriptional regulator [Streptomyces sp. 8L]|uniref:TetR/AcrR family transcriptional regulator n=1 Tax=Streptomyces sp. 8L TaxID=2877242 RepID=UPI001CD7BA06|nr:TetR/AcrR family transcriptional regulator [Streptomyces sp. 8L]MCA1218654.1 TetR/AcrR family transcriptional regulator [Streptomyces sp. 8L]